MAVALLPLSAHALDVFINQDVFIEQGTATDVSGDNGPAGGQFILRAKVKINGITGTLSNVQLTEQLPIGAIFQGVGTPGIACTPLLPAGTVIDASNASLVCVLPEVSTRDFTTVDFRVILPRQGTDWTFIASTASVLGNYDLNPDNNVGIGRTITTFERADLAVDITSPAAGATVTQGNVVNYTVQASNANSPYAFPLKAGERAEVRFAQPQGTVFQGTPTGAGWTCTSASDSSTNPATPFYNCTYLVPDGQAIVPSSNLPLLTFPALVQVAGGNVPAQASIKGLDAAGKEFTEAVWDNNTDNMQVVVQPNVDMDMALTKTVNTPTIDARSPAAVPLTYTLKISRNSGLVSPSGITVTDTLPAGMTFVSAVGNDWACDAVAQVVTCAYGGNLQLGATNPANFPDITLQTTVPTSTLSTAATADQALVNTASLLVPNEPSANSGANNASSATVNITNKTNLAVSKITSSKVVASGQAYYYEIPVKNNGPLNVLSGQTITITDQLDSRLEFTGASGSSSGWTCTPANTSSPLQLGEAITCTLSAGLNAGQTSKLRLNVIPHLSTQEFVKIGNEANLQGVDGRVQASALTNKVESNLSLLASDLSIAKAAAVTPGFVHGDGATGSEVVYTLTAKNNPVNGQSTQTAQTITLTDTVENLITTPTATALGGNTVVPLYANNRYLTAEVVIPAGSPAQLANACHIGGNNGGNRSTVTCTLKNVPVSADFAYQVIIKARQHVSPSSADNQSRTLTNTAEVSSPDTAEQANGLPNKATADVTLSALTDMTVSKVSNPPANAAAGQAITYTLTPHNAGPSQARKVSLQDALPVGAIWVRVPEVVGGSGACKLGNGSGGETPIVVGEAVAAPFNQLICAWNDDVAFGMNAQKVVNYQLRSVTSNPPASLKNDVKVSTATPETNDSNNEASAVVTLDAAQVDVLVNMKHTNDGIPLNTSSTQYTITVTNNATSTSYATGVTMTERFAQPGSTASFEFVSLDSVQSSHSAHVLSLSDCVVPAAGATTGGLVCNFPWLAPGESIDIKFTMRPVALADGRPVGTIYHAASVSSDLEQLTGLDTNANNNTTDRTSTYDPAQVSDPSQLQYVDLSVKKSANFPDQGVLVGDRIAYTLTVKNEEDPAQTSPVPDLVNGQAVITDVLPEGLELVSGSLPSGCTYAAATRTLTCTLVNLKAGAEATFDFEVLVTAVSNAQTAFVNTANVQSPGDSNPENDDDTVDVPVAVLDLALLKTVDKRTAKPGETLTYTLTVTNNGVAANRGGELRDELPAGVSLVDADNACTVTGSTLICVVDSLPSGASQTFEIKVLIADDAALGTLSNTAVVKTPGDTDPTNDTSTVTTEVATFDLVLTKFVDKSAVKVGEELVYTLKVVNKGPLSSNAGEVRDVLPAGLGFVASAACQLANSAVTCALESLPKDGEKTFTFTAKVAAGVATGTLSNTAVLSSPQDGDPSNNESTVTTEVQSFDLALTKSVNQTSTAQNAELLYTFTVVNKGPLPSNAGEIRDVLPAGLSFVASDACTLVDTTVVCAVDSLPMNGEQTFTFTAKVAKDAASGALSNTAVVTSEGDTDPSNNESTATTEVQPVEPVKAVPTMGSIGMLLLGLMMLLLGRGRLRRMA